MAAASLRPCREQTLPLKIRISTFYLQGLGPQCHSGNAFHFAPQRALLPVWTVTGLSLLLSSAWMPLTLT